MPTGTPAPAAARRDFHTLWLGQTISLFGSQCTLLALPITAAVTLGVGPAQMGLLGAVETLPFILLSLPVGVWVDRRRRRGLLVWADLGRALLLLILPALALLGRLQFAHLLLVALAVGVLTQVFDLSYQSYLPTLVGRDRLLDSNGKLEASRSLAQSAGPLLAGVAIQALTAPVTLALDALSFLLAAVCFATIRTPEPDPGTRATRPLLTEIGEGLRFVYGQPLVRAIVGCSGTLNCCTFIQLAVFVLYATRELGLSPAQLGVAYACGGPGALLGALVSARVVRWWGLGRTILVGATCQIAYCFAAPLAGVAPGVALPILMAGYALFGLGLALYGINQLSLRQLVTPEALQGRMNASLRFLVTGAIPIGSLAGGFLGERVGLQPTLLIGGVGCLTGLLWLLRSPLPALRDTPAQAAAHIPQPAQN
ncbi:MAG: MFS transporter [Chloroflexia bacterium]